MSEPLLQPPFGPDSLKDVLTVNGAVCMIPLPMQKTGYCQELMEESRPAVMQPTLTYS